MTKYVPFLKSKSNEIIALGDLSSDVIELICPFFDFPKNKNGYNNETFKINVRKVLNSFKKHIKDIDELYFDNYDIDDSLHIDGMHNYHYLLGCLNDFPVTPVVSIDRSPNHINSVITQKDAGIVSSTVIAIRLTPEDFESFHAIEDDIEDVLGNVFDKFNSIDLVFDCRVCNNLDSRTLSRHIVDFANGFSDKYTTRRIVITGSSIPASIKDLIKVDEEGIFERNELKVYQGAKPHLDEHILVFGDYATVSPNYSEVDIIPEAMQNITTAKFIYSFAQSIYVIRGGSIKQNGFGQYYELAKQLCSKPFYRGEKYSKGDQYLHQKSLGIGNYCTPSAVVKPTINSHITYMVKDAPI